MGKKAKSRFVFQVSGFTANRVELVGETEHTYNVRLHYHTSEVSSRFKKATSPYFDTEDDANRHILNKLTERINKAQEELDRYQRYLDSFHHRTGNKFIVSKKS